MTSKRARHALALYKDRIYCFRGMNERTLLLNEIYNPALDSWEDLPNSPHPSDWNSAAVFCDKIYIASYSRVLAFDPVEERFPTIHEFTSKCFGKHIFAASGSLWVLDGNGPTLEFDEEGTLKAQWPSSGFDNASRGESIQLEDCVYYLYEYGEVYKFSLVDKTFTKVVNLTKINN